MNHFDLLNHPAVYEQLRVLITRAPGAACSVPSGRTLANPLSRSTRRCIETAYIG